MHTTKCTTTIVSCTIFHSVKSFVGQKKNNSRVMFNFEFPKRTLSFIHFVSFSCCLLRRGLFLDYFLFILSNKKWNKINTLTRILRFVYVWWTFSLGIFGIRCAHFLISSHISVSLSVFFFSLCFDLPNDFQSVVFVSSFGRWFIVECTKHE